MGVDDTDSGSDDPKPTIEVQIKAADLARLDRAAVRRGIGRAEMFAQAIDEFLAQEAWSGGFIPPPPPMEVPRRRRVRSNSGRWRRTSGTDPSGDEDAP
ncbi:MAG TPA: CopG family transcriptional regulator [Acidimicrobiales bacterium]|nr:CopG family transcriptional regulator [Acidimicrobiales bacterium]